MKSFAALVRLAINREQVPPEAFVASLADLRAKRLRIKKERVRRTAKAIRMKLVEHDCKLLCCENLDFEDRTEFTRKQNTKLSDWCSREVLKLVRQDCQMLGIFVRDVNPSETSMLDWFKNEFRAPHESMERWRPKDAERDLARLMGLEESRRRPTEQTRLDAFTPFLRKRKLPIVPAAMAHVTPKAGDFWPSRYGDWIVNPDLAARLNGQARNEFVPVGLNGAFNIFCRGFRLFYGGKRPAAAK